ncbi:MAG: SDR family NAD(P)-dependent oxidoreductase [Candidatus Sumerlaeaceae bacterium]
MKLEDRCALVIGASSGIGEALARRLARKGFKVALLARREEELRRLADGINQRAEVELAYVFPHSVTDYDEIPELFDRAVETMGGLTHVFYVASVMPKVAPDEYNFEKDRQMVEVNLLGMIAWLNQAAQFFSRLKAGVIVGVGSIAGDRGRKGNPVYNTSKGAEAIYLEALRNRLAGAGVRVVTIKPGFVETAMTAGMGNLLWMISAEEAARRITEAAEHSSGTVYVPRRWALVSAVISSIPSFVFRKLDI